MDTAKWSKDSGMVVKAMEQISPIMNNNSNNINNKPGLERRGGIKTPPPPPPAQNKEQAVLSCPRCNSTNTKFCYYNNYSLTQPRYFCKTCRRYWTEGGSLRNVPVGGGSRKNKRSITISSSSSPSPTTTPNNNSITCSSFLKIPDLNPQSLSLLPSHQIPSASTNRTSCHDLNLNTYLGLSQFVHHNNPSTTSSPPPPPDNNNLINSSTTTTTIPPSSAAALQLLRTGMIASRGSSSFLPTNNGTTIYDNTAAAGLSFPTEFKPTLLNFNTVEGLGLGRMSDNWMSLHGGVHHQHQENGSSGRLLFPFGELRQQIPSNTSTGVDHQSHNGQENSSGWWNSSNSNSNGMLGGGGGSW